MDNFPLLIPLLTYAGLNVVAFGSFALDKHRAQTNAWRTPETTLLILAALGPFGALAAMKMFRHKTRHTKFLLVPVFAILHILLGLFLFTPVFR
jgi:uncharacterized membrane protein YsdA (DUF1294 family)